MPKIHELLSKEHESAHVLSYKKQYSTPSIYNADGDLSKRWYVYFSFRNPATGKLERQTHVYAGVNQFKTLKERKEAIKILRDAVETILVNGYNPFEDSNPVDQSKNYNIPDAVTFALELNKNTLKENSYRDFRVRLKSFEKWLLANGFENRYITSVNKKTVVNYLNSVLASTSPKNRNNTRSNLSMFFKTLEANEIIEDNFIPKINVLKSTPERNKTFSSDQENDILNYLLKHDTLLLLFIQFISYNHLRPIEVVRLRISDINIKDKLIYVRAKNKAVKTKLIPEILLNEIPNLEKLEPESYLFTPKGIGHEWTTNETDKRGYFGDRFKKVKTSLKLGKDYGLYSFRHTFITKLYKELVKNSTPNEAKSKLMLITGHTTMSALEKYLRDIDAVMPEDYSQHIK
ncbi:phage integrase family protein [Flavobacterium sp. 90]|uniref:tyrosine-type recombinase/integrase n=1 Tax=unclassified Flavobacterium TaxID=196869 RepID=UPI000EB013FF|nr:MULTISPECIES: tyrosine-type recombinase/integrase [unclassified Flavobacterium]RKR11137.1 phage integrase family protein [Flavobacterium sp. 81]TCK54918.1 phage integrase family protein [Flavobacterium sp. 90]